MHRLQPWLPLVFLLTSPGLGGCALHLDAVNPSFSVSAEAAAADLHRMEATPVPLQRPLLIVTGFMDPGFSALSLRPQFASLTGDRRIAVVTLADCCWSLERCRAKILAAVAESFPPGPGTAADETTEVDVIGYSLGGVAARCAALPHADPVGVALKLAAAPRERHLKIVRLFTLSSPHRGADLAEWPPLLLPVQRDLRPGSAFLARLDASPPPYPIYPYVRLGDFPVGEANAAPPGRVAWWVPTLPFSDPHNAAHHDPRILADIGRRLRGETPWASDPASPIPY